MITIRNEDKALSLSARTGEADLKPGMIVKLAQGAADGDQPTCVKAAAADIIDETVQKFIVDTDAGDSLDVDFTTDPTTQALTPVVKTIASGAQVNLWFGTLVIAYHESLIPAGLASARESSKVAFDGDTALPGVYASGATDGLQSAKGFKYRTDGPEHTLVVTL